MKITAIEIKPGMIIEHKNDYWNVLKTQHVKPGKGGAFNQVELKSVIKGTKLNERFRSSETVEKAEVDEKKFVESAVAKKQNEIEELQQKYEKMISETESSIKENEKNLLAESDKYKLYDDSMKKIHNLRGEQTNLIQGISNKYKILLSYNLTILRTFCFL